MDSSLERMELVCGNEGLRKLKQSTVWVFGLGGVGGWCAEALVRSGIGRIHLVDFDDISPTNINRQIQAKNSTVGQNKALVLEHRLKDIMPECEISAIPKLFSAEEQDGFAIESNHLVADCIDTITHKVSLYRYCWSKGAKVFASMGAGRRLDPSLIRTSSLWESEGCALARQVRKRLRQAGDHGDVQCVYSPEFRPATPEEQASGGDGRKTINGSAVHVTASFGMHLAGLIINQALCSTSCNSS